MRAPRSALNPSPCNRACGRTHAARAGGFGGAWRRGCIDSLSHGACASAAKDGRGGQELVFLVEGATAGAAAATLLGVAEHAQAAVEVDVAVLAKHAGARLGIDNRDAGLVERSHKPLLLQRGARDAALQRRDRVRELLGTHLGREPRDARLGHCSVESRQVRIASRKRVARGCDLHRERGAAAAAAGSPATVVAATARGKAAAAAATAEAR